MAETSGIGEAASSTKIIKEVVGSLEEEGYTLEKWIKSSEAPLEIELMNKCLVGKFQKSGFPPIIVKIHSRSSKSKINSLRGYRIQEELMNFPDDWLYSHIQHLIESSFESTSVTTSKSSGIREFDDYYVVIFEYVEGKDFFTFALGEEGDLPLELLIGLFKEMAEIIQALHSKGIVYGDVKPENFLIRKIYPDKPLYTVVLIDFENAITKKQYETSPEKHSEKPKPYFFPTSIYFPVGNYFLYDSDYLPPAVCRSWETLKRGEIFCLGLTYYVLCTGKHPNSWPKNRELYHSLILDRDRGPEVKRRLSSLLEEMIQKKLDSDITTDKVIKTLEGIEGWMEDRTGDRMEENLPS